MKSKEPSRRATLENSLKPLAAVVSKDQLRTAIYATIDAFKSGSGMVYTELEEMLRQLYPEPVPEECDICGRLLCPGHYGEGFQ